MALVTRELQIVYGTATGSTIGAGTSYLIDATDPISLNVGYGQASVGCTVVVAAVTEALFNTACDNLEDAFRLPRQRLRVIMGATTMWDYNPATNSGFNAEASISKPGSPKHDSARSRRYTIRVTVSLPADLSGQNGRVTSSVNLFETDSRRLRCTITGSYTALGNNSARTQYAASIDAYAATVLGGFGGTWEGPFDIRAEADDTDKGLQFSRTYEELIFNQSLGTLNNTIIRRQQLTVDRLIDAPGDSYSSRGPSRLSSMTVSYSAAIDKTQTQDLETVWSDTVKPWLLSNAATVAGSRSQALVSQKVSFDKAENVITATLDLVAAGTSSLVSLIITTKDASERGVILVPVWDGDRHSKYDFQGPASFVRTVTSVSRELEGGQNNSGGSSLSSSFGVFGINQPISIDTGGAGFFGIGGGGGSGGDTSGSGISSEKPPDASPDGGTFIGRVLSSDTTTSHLTIGEPGDPQLNVMDQTTISVIAYFVKPKSGSGS